MKILVLEDELIAAEFLSKMVTDHFEDCVVAGIARSVDEAVELYGTLKPDLLIMDINLGNHLSFELFNHIDLLDLNVIFTTGYQEFALRAFKVNAVDYIMKPVNIMDLEIAINKAREKIKYKNNHSIEQSNNMMMVWENERLIPINIDLIIKIKSQRNYSSIFLTKDKSVITSKNLGAYETLLSEKGFFRIHKSCLINIMHFISYHPGINAKVKLSDGLYESISRRKKDELMPFLSIYRK